jgi:hypothetical protein
LDEDHGRVARWLRLLAVKGVQELFLVNRRLSPSAITTHMPATLFSIATLTRLYLGFWRLPDTAGLPRGAAFPHLRELGLLSVTAESRDIDFILARSPALQILFVQGHMYPTMHLRIVSHSLQCVQIHWSDVETIAVADAPRLERLIMSGNWRKRGKGTMIKIAHAPVLRVFGYFEPENHCLHIGDTAIKVNALQLPFLIFVVFYMYMYDSTCWLVTELS